VPCFRVATPRSWATSSRVPYNRDKRDAKEWRRDISSELSTLMTEKEFYKKYVISSDEEIQIQWQCGRPLLQIHRNAMHPALHNYINAKMNQLYLNENLNCNDRRSCENPKPKHLGPHNFNKMAQYQDTHYGGFR